MDTTFQASNITDSSPGGVSALVWHGHLPARAGRSIAADEVPGPAGIVGCRSYELS